MNSFVQTRQETIIELIIEFYNELNMRYNHKILLPATILVILSAACSKEKSFPELLREEEKATNWYLSGQRVETRIPADSILETGKDAPFYRVDKDGYIYMQVVELGDTSDMAETGDIVYFRYASSNLKWMYNGNEIPPGGNAGNLNQSASFIYGNYQLSSSSQYGQGVQIPLQFVGNNSEVNLVLRSYYGFKETQSECVPYLMNIKYFKAEY